MATDLKPNPLPFWLKNLVKIMRQKYTEDLITAFKKTSIEIDWCGALCCGICIFLQWATQTKDLTH